MSRATTLGLFLVVLVLGGLVWWQGAREDPDLFVVERPLFEGLDVRKVATVRFDNIERSTHVALERDARGAWFLTDPLAYPARDEMVRNLLSAAGNQAWPVPPEERAAAADDLERPRAVLELVERLEEGGERAHRLEMGSVDLDGMRVYVKVDGQLLRTLRNLEVPLEAAVAEWRSRRVFDLDAQRIVTIRRQGYDILGEEQQELALVATREGAGWWISRPVRIHGDPVFLVTWSRILAALSVRRFVSDQEDADLGRWGLDNPWFSLTLDDAQGNSQTVEFARAQGATFARRTDLPYAWEIEARLVPAVTTDVAELYDESLVRLFRREIESVLLVDGERRTRLTQAEEERWTVAWTDPTGEWTVERPAHLPAVEEVLGTLEQERVLGYRWREPVEQYFPEGAPVRALWLESGGRRYGGRVGTAFETEEGTPVNAWLREREETVSVVAPEVAALLDRGPLDFVSRFVVDVHEGRLFKLRLGRRTFFRVPPGIWTVKDQGLDSMEAKELHPVLDRLCYLKAERHVPSAEREELLEPVEVELTSRDGDVHELVTIGRTAGGEVRAEKGSAQSVLGDGELHRLLLGIAGSEDGE